MADRALVLGYFDVPMLSSAFSINLSYFPDGLAYVVLFTDWEEGPATFAAIEPAASKDTIYAFWMHFVSREDPYDPYGTGFMGSLPTEYQSSLPEDLLFESLLLWWLHSALDEDREGALNYVN